MTDEGEATVAKFWSVFACLFVLFCFVLVWFCFGLVCLFVCLFVLFLCLPGCLFVVCLVGFWIEVICQSNCCGKFNLKQSSEGPDFC